MINNIYKFPVKTEWKNLVTRPVLERKNLRNLVQEIFTSVQSSGDFALKNYSEKFDGVKIDDFLVSHDEIDIASNEISEDLKNAIKQAKDNIFKFHNSQQQEINKIETQPGITCWRESRAIENVGLYIPGGTAPLFSTILMLSIPAKIAGCKNIILCTPPQKDGSVNPAILFTAQLCGIEKIYKIGGAQAIAALTFGTESIPKVDKIFGPGNQYVTEAKQLAVENGVAIDMPAGPSEVLVIADSSANPEFCAADLLSQAEHGVDSQVVFVATDEQVFSKTMEEIKLQVENLSRNEMAKKALNNSRFILLNSVEEAFEFSNEYAPEHLILSVENSENYINLIENAGSVFLGNYSPEAAGDYATGTNHTLPTNGFARNYSGVSLDSFVKKITFQNLTQKGLQNIGKSVELMAEAEGLFAHKNAVTLRLKSLQNGI
ncbi:histidinol dehydrogenase [Halpernia sp. GG3]